METSYKGHTIEIIITEDETPFCFPVIDGINHTDLGLNCIDKKQSESYAIQNAKRHIDENQIINK